METSRLRTIQHPYRATLLLESVVEGLELAPSDSDRVVSVSELTPPLRRLVQKSESGVMFLDLDRFKSINDTHGHAAGDGVLQEVARRLLEHARDEDTVCRIGGDEFLLLLMNPQGRENIGRIAAQVLKYIAQPIAIGDVQLVIRASIGIAIYPEHDTTGGTLISHADTAMYRAKKRMSGCAFFNMAFSHTNA